jgi:hypothetical protein
LDLSQEEASVERIRDFIKSTIIEASFNTENDISSTLVFLKALAETHVLKQERNIKGNLADDKTNNKKTDDDGLILSVGVEDEFWNTVISPNLADIYGFFRSVLLGYCKKKLSESLITTCSSNNSYSSESDSSSTTNTISRGGFAHHQLLGLLQKGLRTFLVFVKRSVLNSSSGGVNNGNNVKNLEAAESVGFELCEFLSDSIDVGLDIRCNIGLALVYIAALKLGGSDKRFAMFCEEIFDPGEKFGSEDKLLKRILSLCGKDVNRISFAVGVLNCLTPREGHEEYSKLMFKVGRNILEIDHGYVIYNKVGKREELPDE